MQSDSSPSPPTPSSILLARGVIARLSTWPALQLAVSNSWGGPQSTEKRTWVASVIVDTFEDTSISQKTKSDWTYFEEMLMQIMADEFELIMEDGSAEEVGKDLVRLWEKVCGGGDAGDGLKLVLKLEEEAERVKGKAPVVQQAPGSDDDEDWEDDEDDSEDDCECDGEHDHTHDEPPKLIDHDAGKPQRKSSPEIDEDGFTVVKGKGKSHR
ncbi:hypothetical protein PLEOSDRAFT_1107708 [Pleurotus ostreatus PC15]|uniref:Pre-rRNA-processing protein TSR2 n=1 Tax=Pleurotus ostreatus (strain PC15) TaxID=1137138 RepID=A0A067NL19_PLEO1|nr:hypothetical protein PLEOSDRAFT_1107708 [Pleurotus ostreatus PC15]